MIFWPLGAGVKTHMADALLFVYTGGTMKCPKKHVNEVSLKFLKIGHIRFIVGHFEDKAVAIFSNIPVKGTSIQIHRF